MEFLPKGQATLTAWWRGGRWDGSSQLGGEGMEVLPGKIVERILGREEGGRKGDSGFHLGEEVYGPPRPSFHVDGEREPGTHACKSCCTENMDGHPRILGLPRLILN